MKSIHAWGRDYINKGNVMSQLAVVELVFVVPSQCSHALQGCSSQEEKVQIVGLALRTLYRPL